LAKPKAQDSELVIELLKESHKPLLVKFLSASKDENEFLHKDSLACQRIRLNETYLLFKKGNQDKILSYVTLAVGSIKLSPEKDFFGVKIKDKPYRLPSHIPCMLIGRIATDKTEQNMGYASYLVSFAISKAVEKSKLIPFPVLALHAYPGKIPFYMSFGFEKAFTASKKSETVCMYMPMFKVG